MDATRQTRASRALLALVFGLALLGPGAAGRATAAAEATGSLVAGPADGPEQGLLRDVPGHSLVTPGSKRDDRERAGPALPGLVAATIAAAWTLIPGHRSGRPARHRAAAGARAPQPLRPV
jgi:hypothetical protein